MFVVLEQKFGHSKTNRKPKRTEEASGVKQKYVWDDQQKWKSGVKTNI